MRMGTELLKSTAGFFNYVDPPPCPHKHFYVSIDDGKYLEKCIACDEPKSIVPAAL